MAEGQIGGFYPLNIVIFFLLPFKAAYNDSIILHFILAGVFTYLYARKLGAEQAGGYLSSLLFCFGSAYGGCFCNIATLRVLSWLPLVLLLIDIHFENKNLRYIFLAGIILGFQMLAGSIQMAFYSAFFYLIYYIYKAALLNENIKNRIFAVFVFFTTSFFVALPQLLLSYELSGFSNRENAALGFALWGSFLPPSFLGVIFPHAFSFNSNFYIGVLSLLFVIYGFSLIKDHLSLKPLILVLMASIFFGIGAFNPIYVALLKITKFYIFRNPSKFLFFGMFSLSVLAGYGFSKFFENAEIEKKNRAINIFSYTLSAGCLLFLSGGLLLFLFKKNIIGFGDYYVKHFIYNAPHHRYTLEYYLNHVKLTYDYLLAKFSFSNIFNIFSVCIIVISLLISPSLLRKKLKYAVFIFIFIDIFIFGFYGIGFSGNIRPFSFLKPDYPITLEKLKSDPGMFRILPFDIQSGELPNWSLPNANMIYGIDSIACYSPLANKAYKDRLSGLEVVDDSLGLKPSDEASIEEKSDILRLLNVKYIVSHKTLNQKFLNLINSENGVFLYAINNYLPRIFFSSYIEGVIKIGYTDYFKLTKYKNGLIEVTIKNNKKGFVIFSENHYPGWHVYVDGEEKDMIKIKDLLQGVAIDKGDHIVSFMYKPYSFLFKK